MSTAYAPVPGSEGGSKGGVSGGIKMRFKPLQLLILFGIAAIIGLPLIAGSDRRAQVTAWAMGGNRFTPDDLKYHIAPPSGGIPDEEGAPLNLEARLKHLLSRPALDQWEAELSNRYNCPFFTYARNTYFFHEQDGKDEKWKALSKDEVKQYRRKMVEYLRQLDRDGKKLVWDKSMEAGTPVSQRRGIIYTGGEGKTIERLRIALHMLKNVIKTKLPVEVHHYPGEFTDEKLRNEFINDYGVELIVSKAPKTDGKAWQIKNAAFLDTKFTQFVYMDSDNIALADPAELFESVEFRRSGSVFWADLNKDHPDNAIWRILGRTCSDEQWPAESGQVIYDKSGNNGLNLAVLHLSVHMMDNPDMYAWLSYGDKDTYRYSFYALGLPYQQAPRMFASVGGYQRMDATSSPDYFCGHAALQWGLTPVSASKDPSYHPKPAFLHGILTKHRYGLQPDKLFSHAKRPVQDFILDSRLVRTLYEFTGDCFAITLKGPSGLPDEPNSYGDGQDVIVEPMSEVLALEPHVWKALSDLQKRIAGMNVPGE